VGTLYVVATPIGNLDDISPRAVETLRAVSLIAAEDTRHSRRLLDRYGLSTRLVSYHQHNRSERRERLLAALDAGDVALISDAGTPGISDPGADLVAAALERGHRVSPIPGPSAVSAAASAAGLIEGPFVFLGFLPRESRPRRQLLARATTTGFPFVLFEAPTRVGATLGELLEAVGDRAAVLVRELTKIHEEVRAGTLASLHGQVRDVPPRGEIVLVVAGAESAPATERDAEEVIAALRRAGLGPSQAAKEAATITGLPRSALYEMARRIDEASVRLEGELALPDEDALQNALGDEERPDRRDSRADEG
jgi:16S rRNA (cytidine1402-2'-O)-methyltransferase